LLLVRNFIQAHGLNGSDVTWGSHDFVRFNSVTVRDLEELAQRIRDAALEEQELLERGRL
jgi:hypothetical protein